MLVSYRDLRHFVIRAKDGESGHVDDIYFDDETWSIRYVIARQGFLFTERQGLVGTKLLGKPDLKREELPIHLTEEQLNEADPPDRIPTVAEQQERELRRSQYERWPPLMLGYPGTMYTPSLAEQQLWGSPAASKDKAPDPDQTANPHLRSMEEVSGYSIAAKDGELGSIIDFLIDPDVWSVKFLVADIGTWLPGKQVAFLTNWISEVDWPGQVVAVTVTKDDVENAPGLGDLEGLERSGSRLALSTLGGYWATPV